MELFPREVVHIGNKLNELTHVVVGVSVFQVGNDRVPVFSVRKAAEIFAEKIGAPQPPLIFGHPESTHDVFRFFHVLFLCLVHT